MGFIATPRTEGLLFNHLDCPAFFKVNKQMDSLETVPIVAKHFVDIYFKTPDFNSIVAK